MVQPIGMILAVVLARPAAAKCPVDEVLKQKLGVEGAVWRMTCAATKELGLAMTALLPPVPRRPRRGWSSRSGAVNFIPAPKWRSTSWRRTE